MLLSDLAQCKPKPWSCSKTWNRNRYDDDGDDHHRHQNHGDEDGDHDDDDNDDDDNADGDADDKADADNNNDDDDGDDHRDHYDDAVATRLGMRHWCPGVRSQARTRHLPEPETAVTGLSTIVVPRRIPFLYLSSSLCSVLIVAFRVVMVTSQALTKKKSYFSTTLLASELAGHFYGKSTWQGELQVPHLEFLVKLTICGSCNYNAILQSLFQYIRIVSGWV